MIYQQDRSYDCPAALNIDAWRRKLLAIGMKNEARVMRHATIARSVRRFRERLRMLLLGAY